MRTLVNADPQRLGVKWCAATGAAFTRALVLSVVLHFVCGRCVACHLVVELSELCFVGRLLFRVFLSLLLRFAFLLLLCLFLGLLFSFLLLLRLLEQFLAPLLTLNRHEGTGISQQRFVKVLGKTRMISIG